ncbi:MAG: hypothetical protein K9K63_13520 [Desulfotignum sp.]|nr:hypothetical protein [Desulfotignum sp.]MCF8138320.1 hypothetical protein [Desulfotignum sp.]
MPEKPLYITAVSQSLPPEWPEDLLPDICRHVAQDRTKIVVLDDDPTGTQTVHSLPVLTTWEVPALEKELTNSGSAFFILTNSRALPRDQACRLGQAIGTNLKQAGRNTGVPISIISRSDSTLRGHFPFEVDAVAHAMGDTGLPYLICPFFLEGGRFTINNIHYVREKNQLIPAASTSYAKDAAFGFLHSDLREWVAEKTGRKITPGDVTCVTLDDIRNHGPDRVADLLMTVPGPGACIVNAMSYQDIHVLVAGLLKAQSLGRRFLFRTAASFVRVRAGVVPHPGLLSQKELSRNNARAGALFIAGSYVPKTTDQITALIRHTDILPVEIPVELLLDKTVREKTIQQTGKQVTEALHAGLDTLIYTSRKLISDTDPGHSLSIGQSISDGLADIVRSISCRPRFILAKGGITSSDMATKGLQVRRAMILGQILPGVPVWQLGDESVFPGMPYIIFPGNVGNDDALVRIHDTLHTPVS